VLDLPGSKLVHENRVHCTCEWPVEWFFLGDIEPNSLSLSLSLSPEEKSGTCVTFTSLDDSYA